MRPGGRFLRRSARSLSARLRPSASVTFTPSGRRRPPTEPDSRENETDESLTASGCLYVLLTSPMVEISRAVSLRLAAPARYLSRSSAPRP